MAHLVCEKHGRRAQVFTVKSQSPIRILHRSDGTHCEGLVQFGNYVFLPQTLVFEQGLSISSAISAKERTRRGRLNV